MKDRSALRKGLESIERTAPQRVEAHPVRKLTALNRERGVVEIPIANISADEDQPRKFFDPERLNELANSIREKGVLVPIIVRTTDEADRVVIIAGERRYRAAKLAGLDQMPCLVGIAEDAREVALIENIQREDLSALELAEALQRAKTEKGYTDEQLAAAIGKSRQAVSESLQLLSLPEAIKAECRTSGIATKSPLLQVLRAGDEENQIALWEEIKTGRLATVRAVRKAQKKAQGGRPKNFRHEFTDPGTSARVTVAFSKITATTDDVRAALKAALADLA
jgi:ParB family transcriptional regulator, chromosome partitioning protein